MPPGQFKKLFEVGQRVPAGYRGLMPLRSLALRTADVATAARSIRDSRYVYDQQYLYRVDPTTMVVRQILRLLI